MKLSLVLLACFGMFGCAAGTASGARAPASGPPVATTSPPTPPTEAALDRLLRSTTADPQWFATDFLQTVPVARVQGLLSDFRARLGEYRSLSGSGDTYVALFERGSVPAHALLDEQGRFTGLVFEAPQINGTAR